MVTRYPSTGKLDGGSMSDAPNVAVDDECLSKKREMLVLNSHESFGHFTT